MGRGGSEEGQIQGLRPAVDPAALLYGNRHGEEPDQAEQEPAGDRQSEEGSFELNFDNIDDVLRVNKAAKHRIELNRLRDLRKDLEIKKKYIEQDRREAYRQMTVAEAECLDAKQLEKTRSEIEELRKQKTALREQGKKYLRISGKIGDLGGFAVGGATVVAGAAGGIVATAIVLPALTGAAILAARYFSRRAARFGAERPIERLRRQERRQERPDGPYRDLERQSESLVEFVRRGESKQQKAQEYHWAVQAIDRRSLELDQEIAALDARCQELRSGLGRADLPIPGQ